MSARAALSILYSALHPKDGEYLPAYFYRVSEYANWLTPKELLSHFGASTIGYRETLLPYWIIRYAHSEDQTIDQETIYAQHTEFKFWQGFIGNLAFKNYLNSQLKNSRTGRVLFKGESVLCEHKVIRSCPLCAAEDKHKFGFAYWRAHHQIPTVFTCHRHNKPLHERPWERQNYSQEYFTNRTEIKVNELQAWLEQETKALILLPNIDARQRIKNDQKKLSDSVLLMPFNTHSFSKEWRDTLKNQLQQLYGLSEHTAYDVAGALYLHPMKLLSKDSKVHPLVFLLFKYFILIKGGRFDHDVKFA